jgi:hypothetical protein
MRSPSALTCASGSLSLTLTCVSQHFKMDSRRGESESQRLYSMTDTALQNDLCPYCRTPYLPASTLTVSAGDAANTNRRMDTSLEAMMEHLQSRWDAGHASGRAGQQRLPTGSGMYS